MSNLKISFIGDSHSVLTFGQTVLANFADQASIHFLAFSGLKLQFMTEWWEQKEDLKILNFEKRPNEEAVKSNDPEALGLTFQYRVADVLIVALGTNDIVECVQTKKLYAEVMAPRIQKQLEKIARQRVLFVEPPRLSVDTDFKIRNALLDQVRSFGFTVISCGEVFADQADGVHMTKDMARKYGEHVSKKLLELIFPHH
ncbi:MAG: SGNH/GDSL hydrolase family protein [Bdellovibrionaceae bacterium]|nr:SGNH/GDSL hydrolase family protein [Pseudobdellovibrionaceae bacterium]